jgi:hypothetical protein
MYSKAGVRPVTSAPCRGRGAGAARWLSTGGGELALLAIESPGEALAY